MEDKQKTRVLAVVGPTASGKSELGIYLANRFDGEIVSADSMQIYQELSIGTAQPTLQQQKRAVHHLINFVPLNQAFSVVDYLKSASNAMKEITDRKKLPIVVGGTGQYIDALRNGFSFSMEENHPMVRQQLQEELEQEGKEALWRKLFLIDPAYARTLHYQNSKRVLRAIELYRNTGLTMTEQLQKNQPKPNSQYDFLLIGVGYKDRIQLYQKIEQRVDQMCEMGLVEEARKVFDDPRPLPTVRQAIGYKEFFPYFEGKSSLQESIDFLKQQTRRYAKRQLTWFRRNPDINWFYFDEYDHIRTIYEQIGLFVEKHWNLCYNQNQ